MWILLLLYTCIFNCLSLLMHCTANNVNSPRSSNASKTTELCEREMFRANCVDGDDSRVVVMKSAKYGRMKVSRCLKAGSKTDVNCDIDVLPLFDLHCSGRRSCEVRVSSIIDHIAEHQLLPCVQESRGYLEATFLCLPVISFPPSKCMRPDEGGTLVKLNDQSGYFGNIVTEESGCGSIDVPWILQAPRGQTIHLHLLDFTVANHDKSSCQVHAVVKEKTRSTGHTICSSDQREQNVYASETDMIEVRIVAAVPNKPLINKGLPKRTNLGYFLLKYTLHGCADLSAVSGGWVDRTGSVSVIICNNTNERFQLICDQNSWVGELKECSSSHWGGPMSSSSFFGSFWIVFTESQWIAVATIIGIALIIGVIIFLAGIIFLKRRRQQTQACTSGVCSSPRCLAEYHLARCGNDLTSLSRHGSATPKSLSLDLAGGSLDGSNIENDYFRTWQLQRNAFNNSRCPNSPLTNSQISHSQAAASGVIYPSSFKPLLPCHVDQDYNCSEFENFRRPVQHQVEHIYESPKFDRKEYDKACCPGTIQNAGESLPLTAASDDNAPIPLPPRTDCNAQCTSSRT